MFSSFECNDRHYLVELTDRPCANWRTDHLLAVSAQLADGSTHRSCNLFISFVVVGVVVVVSLNFLLINLITVQLQCVCWLLGIMNAGPWMLDDGCWMLDAAVQTPVVCCLYRFCKPCCYGASGSRTTTIAIITIKQYQQR